MDDTITIGQKLGFVMVIVFLLALSSAPFLSSSEASEKGAADQGNQSAHRDVAVD